MALTLRYKFGLRSIRRAVTDNQNILTRIYAFGSTRNLGTSYRSGENRLRFEITANLVLNSSFETGDFTSWTQWGSPDTREIVSANARFGTYSYHHIGSNTNAGSLQTITGLSPSTTYSVSCYVYTASARDIRMMSTGSSGLVTAWQSKFNKWERIELQITTSPSQTSAIVYLGGNGECWFDAVMVEESAVATQYSVAGKSFVEDNTYIPSTIEKTVIFEDVFPRRTGTISGVDGSDVLKFTDSSIDFDVNDYLISGLTAKVHFNSGDLAGYEIEVSSFDNGTKEFTLLTYTDENGFTFPSADLKPAVNDEYVLVDITMPTSYIDTAETELQTRAIAHLSANNRPRSKFEVTSDWRYFKTNDISLVVGDNLTLVDSDLDVNKELRIVHLEQSLTNPFKYTRIDLSDFVSPPVLDNIFTGTRNVTVLSQRQDVDLNQHTVYINRNADEIDLRVEKDGVIAAVNISLEGIKIEGDNIQLTGDTQVTGTFTLNGDAIVSGAIESDNWGASAGGQLDLANGTLKFGGSSSPDFSVDAAGALTSVSGVIGGFTIDSAEGLYA